MTPELDDLTDLIMAAYPDGFSEEEGRLIYSVLCGGDVVLDDGRRLHASWRGTGGCVADARGEGDYLDYYLGFRAHDDPEVVPVRERLLAVDGVARIESFPREGDPLFYPQEQSSAAHPTGWDMFEFFELAPERKAEIAAAALRRQLAPASVPSPQAVSESSEQVPVPARPVSG